MLPALVAARVAPLSLALPFGALTALLLLVISLRMGFNLFDSLVLVAIFGVLVAILLPAVVSHHPHRNRVRNGGREPARQRPDTDAAAPTPRDESPADGAAAPAGPETVPPAPEEDLLSTGRHPGA